MAFDLNPLALANAPILRLIAKATDHEIASIKGLADAAGRDQSNVGKSLKALEAAGIINPDPLMNGLTVEGQAQLAALDRAADPTATGELSALITNLIPHPLNPRKDFESDAAEDGLNELRESILLRGLMQPIVVRPGPEAGTWWIVDGERRFRAIQQANWDGDWDDDKPVPIVIREVDDREHLLLSLTANLQRADMSAIEEAVAFHASVHDFGMGTEDLANELGKSQRYVQQRIALLKLSAEDQDRMRLPRDHPDHLSFKAARALSQTPREPELLPHQEFSALVAQHLPKGAPDSVEDPPTTLGMEEAFFGATPARHEPGSPLPSDPDPAPTFDSTLSDQEALLLVEIADKSEREPDADLGTEGYTRVQAVPVSGAAASLVARNIIGFRQRGTVAFVTPRLHGSGAKAWLEQIGFYTHRDDVLFEMRTRVLGARAIDLVQQYATPWLNPADPSTAQPSALPKSPTPPQTDAEPTQPELIEESPDERAAREQRQAEAEAQAATQAVADAHARRIIEWMNFARFRREGGIAADATDYLTTGEPLSPEDLAVALYRALAKGALTEAGVILAVLQKRGDQVARPTLEQMPAALIVEVVEAARAPAPEEDAD